jgi:PAS domain S-box-containing protein
VLLAVLLGVLPAMGVAVATSLKQRSATEEEIRLDLHRLALAVRSHHHYQVEAAHQLLAPLAVASEAEGVEQGICARIRLRLDHPASEHMRLGLFDTRGNLRCGSATNTDRSLFGASWRNPGLGDAHVVVGHRYDPESRRSVSGFTIPVVDRHGVARGVVMMTTPFDGFDNLIRSARFPGQVSLSVVDGNGIVMFRHPRSTAQSGEVLPEDFLLPAIRSGRDETLEHTDATAGRVMYAVTPLDGATGRDAALVLGLPMAAPLAVADRWLMVELAAMALAGILSLVVATSALHRFTLQPLGRLLETTARLGTGELSARTGLDDVPGEVGLLAYAFDGMAASLQDRQEKLRYAEIRVRALLEQSIAGVYLVDAERVLYVNDAFARIFGRSADDLMQHARTLDLVHPDDRFMVAGNIAKRLSGQVDAIHHTFRGVRADGSTAWCEVFGRRIEYEGRPAILGTLLDVTEHRQAEQSLRESEAHLRAILEAAPIGMAVIDDRGHFAETNERLRAMLGYTRDELRGRSVTAVTHEDDVVISRNLFCELLEGKRDWYEHEKRYRRRDGLVFDARATVALVKTDGANPRAVAMIEDVTGRHALEAQLLQSQKMEAVGRLAGGVAHDFNNLLMVISGHADALAEGLASGTPLRRDADQVRNSAQRAAALTRQLLAFSRKQQLKLGPVDLNGVVTHTAELLRRLIGEDITLRTKTASELGTVRVDQAQLEQVFMNLVVNARDAMPGGGALTIETANVDVDEPLASRLGLRPGPYVMLGVTDTGCGMDAATQARIFEPFFTTKEQGQGTGLGLSTVYGIVRQCEGAIGVSSQPGVGTTFTIYLPRIEARPVEALPVGRELQVPAANGTILLVEDEEDVRDLLTEALQRTGYTVLPALTGGDAVRVAALHHGPIDAMLSDVVMPGMSGPEAWAKIAPDRPEMQVVFMSGYAEHASLQAHLVRAPAAFLNKPFSRSELASTLQSVLAEKGA